MAYALFLLDMLPEAFYYFEQAIQMARKVSDKSNEFLATSQYAFASALRNPALSETLSEQSKAIAKNINLLMDKLGGHLLARELILSNPDNLSSWPEFLRTSRHPDPINFPVLQKMLDLRVANANSAGNTLPTYMIYGQLCNYIYSRGYLSFIRRFFGVHPSMSVEWILSKSEQHELKTRIAVEWMINKTGFHFESRRGFQKAQPDHIASLKKLRGIVLRLALEQELEISPRINIYKPQKQEIEVDLKEFYSQHRISEKWIETALTPEPIDVNREKGNDPDILSIMMKVLSGQKLTAADYGASVDNFLNSELFTALQKKYASTSNKPVIVELFQGENEAYWVCCDLSKGFNLSSVNIYSINITRQDAKKLIKQVKSILKAQHDIDFDFDQNLLEISGSFSELFAPLIQNIGSGTELLMHFNAPWNVIPMEQIPFDNGGNSLVDLYFVTRRDRFSRWLTHQTESLPIKRELMFFFGDPLGDRVPELALPHARLEAEDLSQKFNASVVIGKDCTKNNLENKLQKAQLFHIACHGAIFEDLGDFTVLLLEDNYLLGQELASLDLSELRFAVLSACTSGLGSTYGMSEMENLAEFLIEGGAASVLASQFPIPDKNTKELMNTFYELIYQGLSVCEAVRITFGVSAKRKYKIVIMPWILIGENQRLIFEGEKC